MPTGASTETTLLANNALLTTIDADTGFIRTAVQLIKGEAETEASGGITLNSLRKYAECGVDFISVGALTHSVHNMDLSLKAI